MCRREDSQSDNGLAQGSDLDFWALCDPIRIPVLKKPYHIVCCLLNFVVPGLGTVLSSHRNFLDAPEDQLSRVNWSLFIDGCLQFLLSVIILGYLWSCWAGYHMLKKGRRLDKGLTK